MPTTKKKKKVLIKKKTVAKKKMKRAVRKVMGKKKMIKKVTKKVTKKVMKKIHAKSSQPGLVGMVVHYYDKIGVAILELKDTLTVGDLLTFRRGAREFTQPVSSMQINHEPVQRARKGDVVGVKVVQVADVGTMALQG